MLTGPGPYIHFPFYYAYPFFLAFAVVKSKSYNIWYVSRFSYRWNEKTDLVTSFRALHMYVVLAPAGNSKRMVVSTAASTRYGEWRTTCGREGDAYPYRYQLL